MKNPPNALAFYNENIRDSGVWTHQKLKNAALFSNLTILFLEVDKSIRISAKIVLASFDQEPAQQISIIITTGIL